MSSIELQADAAAAHRSAATPLLRAMTSHPRLMLVVAIFFATALGQLTALAKFQAAWSTGAFFDTDDAMRAVQVRDLAAGQGWFDMSAYRLDPPAGVFMHWSRVVDVPLLILMKGFGLIADPVMAERLARLAFPVLLTIALFALLVFLCETLLGASVRYPALAAAFLSGPATGQFEPGRIDHHAPQIVLLVVAVSMLCHALINARARFAAVAGAAVSLSMAISVENVPFLVALVAALILIWIFDGPRAANVLSWFAAGIGVTLPLVYLGTISPSRWTLVAADALSFAQGTAMMTVAGLCLVFALSAGRLPDNARVRAIVAAGSAGAVAAFLACVFPMLTENPFAHLDPLMRTLWLDGVEEAQPLVRKFSADPLWTLGVVAPALVGLAGALWNAAKSVSPRDRAWTLIAVTAAAGLAASVMMVRTLSPVLTLGVPGALALALAARDRLATRYQTLAGPFGTLLLILSLSSVGWAAGCNQLRRLKPPQSAAGEQHSASGRADFSACTKPAAFAELSRLPTGLVLAEPDLGAYILAFTSHSVVAGAYHRNERGMRSALLAFLAAPEEAQARVSETHASYVVYCRSAADPQYNEIAPTGLAARLSSQHEPAWLRHLVAEKSGLDIYVVKTAR